MQFYEVGEEDYEEINGWYKGHNLDPLDNDLFPLTGIIVPGIAAGFLIRTDCAVAFLEGFVTNPLADKENRRIAIDKIAEHLIEDGKDKGVRTFMALTEHPSIVGLCEKYGFKEMKLRIFGKH